MDGGERRRNKPGGLSSVARGHRFACMIRVAFKSIAAQVETHCLIWMDLVGSFWKGFNPPTSQP